MSTASIFAQRPSLEERLESAYLSSRTSLFDDFVTSTQERFWDPGDVQYIDYSLPFDLKQPLLPLDHFPELEPLASQIPLKAQIEYVNHQVHRIISGFYYGEQAALLTCLKEADELSDPSAVEYAINQAREESRHQHGFQRYIQMRFGEALPLSIPYREMILRQLNDGKTQRKFVGVQIVLEGLGLATLGYVARASTDPVLRRLVTLVMADEAQHHRAGRMLIKKELSLFSLQEKEEMADEALASFKTMELLYMHAGPLQAICAAHNLAAAPGLILAEYTRNPFYEAVFRRNAGTIDNCGLITERTRPLYTPWLDASAQDSVQDEEDQQLVTKITADLSRHNATKRNRHNTTQAHLTDMQEEI